MSDLLAAIGLLLAIEGICFAAFPSVVKRAVTSVLDTPDGSLRLIGIATAVVGVAIVWLVRG